MEENLLEDMARYILGKSIKILLSDRVWKADNVLSQTVHKMLVVFVCLFVFSSLRDYSQCVLVLKTHSTPKAHILTGMEYRVVRVE